MGLLKTVFEVNLQLFQQQRGYHRKIMTTNDSTKERALLLFVLRDHIGTTPLSNLAETLKKDLSNIWSNLSKPPGLESCKIQDYFDFQFTALPHKILLPDQFNEKVDALRTRYIRTMSLLMTDSCRPRTQIMYSMQCITNVSPSTGFHCTQNNVGIKSF